MAQSDLALSLHTVGLQRLDHEFNQSPSVTTLITPFAPVGAESH
jgi:hypothetical protein